MDQLVQITNITENQACVAARNAYRQHGSPCWISIPIDPASSEGVQWTERNRLQQAMFDSVTAWTAVVLQRPERIIRMCMPRRSGKTWTLSQCAARFLTAPPHRDEVIIYVDHSLRACQKFAERAKSDLFRAGVIFNSSKERWNECIDTCQSFNTERFCHRMIRTCRLDDVTAIVHRYQRMHTVVLLDDVEYYNHHEIQYISNEVNNGRIICTSSQSHGTASTPTSAFEVFMNAIE